jgi:hypothetical protein
MRLTRACPYQKAQPAQLGRTPPKKKSVLDVLRSETEGKFGDALQRVAAFLVDKRKAIAGVSSLSTRATCGSGLFPERRPFIAYNTL